MPLNPSHRVASALGTALPLLLGVAAFFLVTGGALLPPGNVRWLQHSDLAQSYLGWAFYRHDPWTLPFGANPSYGLEFHSSVYYSDSIPLVAMALKPVAAWLPEPFQYFGLWLLLCFALQALFAWRLLALATPSLAARALGCVFFVLAPPMLVRLGGHMALCAHWAILAALYLYLRPSQERQRGLWTVLVAVAMLVHAYIFLMVAALWAADLVRRALAQARARQVALPAMWQPVLREAAQVVAATLAVAWLAGFFMVPGRGMHADGFGYYKMNLLAPFNGNGWSFFGLHMAQAAGEYEGFNYLGLGGLALCLLAVPAWLLGKRRAEGAPRRMLWPLLAVAIALALFAVTHHIGLGAEQWRLPLPAALQKKLDRSAIQATGRLFWVAYYTLLIGALFALARALPPRGLVAALGLLVAVQLVDLRPGLASLHTALVQRATLDDAPPLEGPFWTQAAQRYTRLRLVPSRILAPGWERLARYAREHGMATDAIQVARADWKVFTQVRTQQVQRVTTGTPEEQTLYILDPAVAATVARAARPGDAVFALDGLDILAPGWNTPLPAGAANLKHSP
ncbi:DUF6311 domain-containing protein [Frateuria defendens]|uniref:DUF6311 domain-containing protein n=1 Tax=Frateuria defendens TaxID=2219559 RepID=UPI00066FFB9B|nr:DUF6311 domain-containing protein [Frateuria defendens]